ncbi:hypothetical protein XA68_14969 [Ophiocordyceps unilateralis]|uniref:Uncharacterized protein n=1 Tax=Ophiocordyceps unilateralis TaxID=268505 RepID=A0A2A9PMN6_OPHUN|nr:hypothetical protein XA68_14969 [Ophiocordyceps unilateralis]
MAAIRTKLRVRTWLRRNGNSRGRSIRRHHRRSLGDRLWLYVAAVIASRDGNSRRPARLEQSARRDSIGKRPALVPVTWRAQLSPPQWSSRPWMAPASAAEAAEKRTRRVAVLSIVETVRLMWMESEEKEPCGKHVQLLYQCLRLHREVMTRPTNIGLDPGERRSEIGLQLLIRSREALRSLILPEEIDARESITGNQELDEAVKASHASYSESLHQTAQHQSIRTY